MADNEKKNLSKEERERMEAIDRVREITTGSVYGLDQDFRDENKEDLKDIGRTINKINNNYKNAVGENIIEFFNRINMEREKKSNNEKKYEKENKQLIDVQKLVDPDNETIQKMMTEGEKNSLYYDYDMIYNSIPQLAQALDTYVDNIISPDDFTKRIFNLFYDNNPVVHGEETSDKRVINNLRNITKSYNIESKCQKIIRNTLKYGKFYVGVFELQEEFEQMLNEDELFALSNEDRRKFLLESRNVELGEDKREKFNEMFDVDDEEISNNDMESDLADLLNENVKATTDSSGMTGKVIQAKNDFESEIKEKLGQDITVGGGEKSTHTGGRNEEDGEEKGDSEEKSDDEKQTFNINGSVVRNLNPSEVVKLEVNNSCFGYYHIEKLDEGQKEDNPTGGSAIDPDGNLFTDKIDINVDGDEDKNAKTEFLTDVFTDNIGEKLDKDFIKDNSEFKDVIYDLVKNGYILNKKVKITYLAPNEVIEFSIGESIYRKVLFAAKLYLAILTNTILLHLTRTERRKFFIEVGVDEDIEGAIQSFVRDIKNKEISMGDLESIDTVLNSPGQFEDMFIPTVNGDRPIEIETESGGPKKRLDNEFLEFLLRMAVNGMGIPSEFINEDRVEFARSLAMKNGKFVRSVINFQKMFGEGFSELYRVLYRNEYFSNDKSKQETIEGEEKEDNEGSGKAVELNLIKAIFPPPSSLNMTNMSDQIRNSRDIIEFIVNTLVGERADDEDKVEITKKVAKDMVPAIHWDKYENMMEEIEMEENKEELKQGENDEDEGSGGGGGSW